MPPYWSLVPREIQAKALLSAWQSFAKTVEANQNLKAHSKSHSINLLRRYVCMCVLANSKCIFIQHSCVRLFVNVNVIRKHTRYTHSSSECCEPHLKTNCDFQAQRIYARSPPIFFLLTNCCQSVFAYDSYNFSLDR